MTASFQQVQFRAKFLGNGFFILLALINVAFELVFSNFSIADVVLLSVFSLPIIINKKPIYIAFGLLMSLFSLVFGIAYLMICVESANVTIYNIIFGAGIAILSFSAALAILYTGLNSPESNRFSLI